MSLTILQPPDWARPRGYSNGIAATGRLVFVAGQIAWSADQQLVSDQFAPQFEQAMRNVLAVCAEAGAGPEHIAKLTWYVTDKHAYLEALPLVGAAYRALMGRNYPAMAVVQVTALVEDGAMIEIEAMAVVPG